MKKKKRDLSAENINRFINHFTPIYEDDKIAKPLPDKKRITVWCNNERHVSGFAVNVTTDTIGLNALIAVSWIYQTELNKLIDNDNV